MNRLAFLKQPLLIKQGDTFELEVEYALEKGIAIEIQEPRARMQFRKKYNEDLLLETTTESGEIAIDSENGKVFISIPANIMQSFPASIFD